MRACVRACVCACVRACVRAYTLVHTYTRTCTLNYAQAIPLVYKLDKNFKPVSVEGAYPPLSARYACDPAVVKAAIEGVAAQTGPKKA